MYWLYESLGLTLENFNADKSLLALQQMYSEGSTAVKQDNKTAFNWFKKAADAVS